MDPSKTQMPYRSTFQIRKISAFYSSKSQIAPTADHFVMNAEGAVFCILHTVNTFRSVFYLNVIVTIDLWTSKTRFYKLPAANFS